LPVPDTAGPWSPRRAPAHNDLVADRYTVDELARLVGMSPRNIRAHQARKLLAPPVRQGRTAFYHAGHLRRLEAIKALQRQGFNLVAIEAILGARDPGSGTEALNPLVQRLTVDHPYLVHALARHGIVVRAEDGGLRAVRPRVLRSALDLHALGLKTGPSLQVLVEVLDRLRGPAYELVRTTSARVLTLAPEAGRPAGHSWAELDRSAATLAQGLTALLTEAFRVAVENSGQAPELLSLDEDGFRPSEQSTVDNG
jgi:DNA-binding transcriptional MerR regulator